MKKPLNTLSPKILKKFLKLASETLTGEWVFVGGTVLPSLGVEHRPTVDIDFVALQPSNNDQTLKLMSIAEKLALPVESINQAASYFFFKTKYQKEDLIPLLQEKNCIIYRPSVTLFLILKIQRMSPTDLDDCREMLRYAKKLKEPLATARVKHAILTLQASEKNTSLRDRREELLKMF
jgi:hypothetical protein